MSSPEPIHIAGGGLAGLALGVALRQLDIPAQITEAQPYPRHRLCGEFLHGSGAQMLTRLGLDATVLPIDSPIHREVLWLDERGAMARHNLPAPVRGLSRYWLDQALAERFKSLGGELEFRRLASAQLSPRPGLALATGRARQPSPWFGIKQHLRGLDLEAGLEMHLGSRGYLGLTPVEDGWINACGIFRVEDLGRVRAEDRLATLLERSGLIELAKRIRRAEARPGSLCGVAGLRLGRQPSPSGSVSLGDAFHCTAPLTGNGQSMALEAGVRAAPELARWSRGELPWPAALAAVYSSLNTLQHPRTRLGLGLHRAVLNAPVRRILAQAARHGLIPFASLAHLIAR